MEVAGPWMELVGMFIGKAPGVGCGVARRLEGAAMLLCFSGGWLENLRGNDGGFAEKRGDGWGLIHDQAKEFLL